MFIVLTPCRPIDKESKFIINVNNIQYVKPIEDGIDEDAAKSEIKVAGLEMYVQETVGEIQRAIKSAMGER